MTAVPHQVTDFLKLSAPFDALEGDALYDIASNMAVFYLTEQNKQTLLTEHQPGLFLVHSGQFSVKDSDSTVRHLSEGDYFGYAALLDKVPYPMQVVVDSPGLIYVLPAQAFAQCCRNFSSVERFFKDSQANALHNQAVTDSNSMWLYKPLNEVISGKAVCAEQDISIREAASIMSRNNVSSLLITQQHMLSGIVTDRDLRNRVVAQGLDIDQPVAQIMTLQPSSIKQHRTLFDAMSIMSEVNIHHLPVVTDNGYTPIGMLTASDIIRHQRGNVLFIIGELSKAQSLYELIRSAWQIPQYFVSHAKRPGDFDIAGKVLSQATDIMTRKLIGFFQQQHGNAPMPFCWLVYGSQAREDQTIGSDQDNGLLLAQHPQQQEADYFAMMSDYVCKGLGKCGIKLCAGNIMASNPQLRLSVEDAIAQAQQWVAEPTPQAIMHFNIFLDARAVAGDTGLFAQMQQARSPMFQQRMFLAALARHANQARVPLSMFQKFVYAKGQQQSDCIDMKTAAIAIINDLVRLYALAAGIKVPATLQRLASLAQDSGLSTQDASNLRDIWLFINRLRWRHQLRNSVTNNLVSIGELSSIEKHQLKASFQAIHTAQQAAVLKFSGGVG